MMKIRISLLLLSALLVLSAPFSALADHGDYATWADAADRIDQYLDEGFELYLAGDTNKAYASVNSAYFRVYETTGFERQTMSYVSGPRKNAVEMQFSACKGAVKKTELDDETKKEVRAALFKLKSMIREDGNKLAAKDGEEPSEITYYLNGEKVDYDPYPELASDPNAAVRYKNWAEAADAAGELLNTALESYTTLQSDMGKDNVDNAYYEVYEASGLSHRIYTELGVEEREKVDALFQALWSRAKKAEGASKENNYEGWSKKQFTKAITAAKSALNAQAGALDSLEKPDTVTETETTETAAVEEAKGDSGWPVFFASFGIIIREGLEAILVIAAIIAYLVKSGNGKNLRNVYIGSILGILASFAAAALLAWIKNVWVEAGGQSQEVIEGITALIAVCVLFYVSNWMISKAEAATWKNYIDSKVESSVERGSAFALAFTAFLSVFREGAEVVLFIQPMLSENHAGMVWVGLAAAAVVLVFIYLAITKLSIKLPIKVFFTATSILMAVMCVSFLGSGIKELAEGNVFDLTMNVPAIPENDVLQVLGIYPYLETLVPQLILGIVLLITFMVAHYRGKMDALKAQYESK